MPYGVAKKAGGDSQANDAKMESCVSRLQAKGYSKVSAIKICKTSIARKAAK